MSLRVEPQVTPVGDRLMLDTVKTLLANQFEATLCTLNTCIDRCPETSWNALVAKYRFCTVVFHTLFYTDFYLGHDEESFRQQPFHRENAQFFGDYEEFEDREPVSLYDRPSIKKYLASCRGKASEVIAAETAETLSVPAGFRKTFSRAELHVYNIRHIQHHSAQLILRLRISANQDFPWFGSGWREV